MTRGKSYKNNTVNNEQKEEEVVKAGEVLIQQEKSSKLFGINIDDDLGWKNHVFGKGGLISSLNQRTHMIRRLRHWRREAEKNSG